MEVEKNINNVVVNKPTNPHKIRDVADILGHRNVETTENYYISSTEKSKRLATDVFDKITKSEIIEEIIKYK